LSFALLDKKQVEFLSNHWGVRAKVESKLVGEKLSLTKIVLKQ
jgi:hypothetical protein